MVTSSRRPTGGVPHRGPAGQAESHARASPARPAQPSRGSSKIARREEMTTPRAGYGGAAECASEDAVSQQTGSRPSDKRRSATGEKARRAACHGPYPLPTTPPAYHGVEGVRGSSPLSSTRLTSTFIHSDPSSVVRVQDAAHAARRRACGVGADHAVTHQPDRICPSVR